MSDLTLSKSSPATTRRRSKDFFCTRVPFDGGEIFSYNLETVLNLLAVEGHDRWMAEELLRIGMPVRSSSASYTALTEHIEAATTTPRPPADDPNATYKLLQTLLSRDHLRLVDELLTNIRSRLNNLAQITSFNAAAWEEDDQVKQILLDGITQGLTWGGNELAVLTGGNLGRAAGLPAFSFPACWTGDVPPEPEPEEELSDEEQRDQDEAERGFEDAKQISMKGG